ncbi:VOC family protein [Anaerosolibacter sp.]|uniref:VOC family protein n=1 Tax=Anaerosolibacter sp. TaxID=1872527 RepID=UPI0039EF8B4F
MLNLGSTYLIVKDIQKSITFYEALLGMKVSVLRFDRWAQFNFNAKCIALLNPKYDEALIDLGNDLEVHYSNEYREYLKNRQIQYGNNMVLNFYTDDLNKEMNVLKSLT